MIRLSALVVAFWFGLLTSAPVFALIPEHEQAILNDFGKNSASFAADALSEEEQQWFLDYLLKEKASHPTYARETFETQLLQLKHEPTIQKHAALLKRGLQASEVRQSNQPRLIEFFEDALILNEPAVPANRTGDIPPQSVSVGAAWMMIELTMRSREIPGETRAWASALNSVMHARFGMNPGEQSVRSYEESRLIVRKWWAENKQAFKAREFGKVKPGLIHSELKGKPAEEAAGADDSPKAELKESPPAAAAEPARKESSILPMLLTGCLLLLLALSLWLGNRRKPPTH